MKKLLPSRCCSRAGSSGAQSHLDKVLQQKTLEVCTTGDYKALYLPQGRRRQL